MEVEPLFASEQEWLRAIQTTGFAVLELQLYLDSHPEDPDAIEDYTVLAKRLKTLKHNYEHEIGPLTGFYAETPQAPTLWVEQPWPWEH